MDHTVYDTTAILKLIETRWNLAPLGSRVSKRLAQLPAGQTIHLHATDSVFSNDSAFSHDSAFSDGGPEPSGAGEWLISLTGGGYSWSHGHAKGSVAVRGPAALLLQFVYGRVRPDDENLAAAQRPRLPLDRGYRDVGKRPTRPPAISSAVTGLGAAYRASSTWRREAEMR